MDRNMSDFLYARRKEMGISQRDLARAIGLSNSTVSRIESDTYGVPDNDTLRRIAEFLRCDYYYLLALNGQIDDQPEIRMIQRAAKKMSPEQVEHMMAVLKATFPKEFEGTDEDIEPSTVVPEETPAKYYYLEADTIDDVERFDKWLNRRVRVCTICRFIDYPTHKRDSDGCVQAMELIPEKRYLSTLYMHRSDTHFSSIELKKADIICVDGKKYIKDFEKRLNTMVWQKYKNKE